MTQFSAFAYIDPASGSLAIQFLIAAAVSAGFVMRNYVLAPFFWMARMFRGRRS